MARTYRYISGDGHLEISPEQWRHWVDPKHRDRAPRAIETAAGTAIMSENSPLKYRTEHPPNTNPEDWNLDKHVRLEDMPGGGPPEQRVRELDQDGIDAEVLFPGLGGWGLWNNIADDDAYLAIVYGYNELLAKEFCAVAPDRLIGMGVMPRRGVDYAIAELEHCANLGLKGIVLGAYPSGKDRLTAEDDRFWAAALDMDMPVTIHAGLPVAPGDYLARRLCVPIGFRGCAVASLALTVHGVFERFPKLQLYIAETGVAWAPAWLEQVDVMYKKGYHFQYDKLEGLKALDCLPSEIIREHVSWGMLDDRLGIELCTHYGNYVGVNKAIWGHDFPHKPTDWPHSLDQIERIFAGVSEEDRYQMLVGNAVRYFHLDG